MIVRYHIFKYRPLTLFKEDMFTPVSITFFSYLVIMVIVGLVAWRFTKNFNDYILGGRKLGALVTALSVGASDMSGWLLMGLPGAVFLSGICESWIAIGLALGTLANWLIVAAPLRVYTETAHNALTLPDYFSHRFEDNSRMLRVISAIVILLFFAIYSASGMVASARLFELVFNMPYETALVFGTIATLAYVFLGGFLAVSWTDTIQATMMCLALIIAPIAVMVDLGGFSATIDQVRAIDPNHLNMLQGQTFIGVISLLAWGLGYFGQPHILVRFMAAKNAALMPRACRISMIWLIFSLTGAVAAGFFGAAFFSAHPDLGKAVAENHERVFMVLSTTLFNPWIGGVLLSAILAAVMSTLSCQLLVCSSVLTEDFYRVFIRPNANQRELVWIGRLTVIAVSCVAIVIAMDPNNLVLSLVSYAWGGFGAAFGPIIILSLLWKGCTKNGALAGIIVGALTVLVWHQGAWWGLYEIIPGFVLSFLTIIVVSLLDPHKPSTSMLATFHTVQRKLDDIKKQV